MIRRRTVLIADDDAALVRALAIRCEGLGLEVFTAANGLDAMLKIRKMSPDILILDIDMPVADGFRVCVRLRELQLDRLSTIVLTGRSDADTRQRCDDFGAAYVRKSHHTWDLLEPKLCEMLRALDQDADNAHDASARPEPLGAAPKVLVVDDDPDITRAIRIRLGHYGVETFEATNGLDGYLVALKEQPDVVITDYIMPEGSGDHMMIRLKQSSVTDAIPVIVLTGQTDRRGTNVPLQRDALGRRGAVAFLAKPLDLDKLLAELQRHIHVPMELPQRGAGAIVVGA
jgi:CheY-like chemotaxis protein